ncbi:MAG TPA: phosphatase PAP2 family protein [Longimicrobiaceae bacterium]|nr:phosphatase PAP2 family protein [Longimicrobiaceae bacterium]
MSRIFSAGLLLSILASGPVTVPALHAQEQVEVADTVRIDPEPLFTPRDLIFAGGFVLGTIAMAPLDEYIAEELQDSVRQANDYLSGTAAAFRVLGHPGALYIGSGIYVAGIVADYRPMADVGLHTVESILVGEAFTVMIKGLAGRARPFADPDDPYNFELGRGFGNDEFRSFPSGHATAAFAAAAAVTTEMAERFPDRKLLVGSVMFGGATMVGISRGYNNEHWASDVVAGAAIGSFAGWKVVHYHHTHPDNFIDRVLLSTRVVPERGGGVVLAWSLPAAIPAPPPTTLPVLPVLP